MDATCAPSQIRYPHDTSLLNEAGEKTEKMIDAMHVPGEAKPWTYRKNARRDYVNFAKTKKKGAKKIRRQIRKRLGYLARNLGHIDRMLSQGGTLTPRQEKLLETIRRLHEQQRRMHETKTHSVSDRIVSFSQPWLRPIVRGKAKDPVEFGAKLDRQPLYKQFSLGQIAELQCCWSRAVFGGRY